MQFEEFRKLIEERKRLVHGADKENNFLRIQEIDQKLCPEKWNQYKDLDKSIYLDWMQSGINLLFEVGRENVIKMLENFFKDQAECSVHNNRIFVETRPIQKCTVYCLGKYNDILYCLCTDGQNDWEKLLHDYPDLREHLWNEFKAIKNTEKTEQISLIKKMIDERNKEQDFLKSPEKTAARIREIIQEKKELNRELSSLTESLEEIKI